MPDPVVNRSDLILSDRFAQRQVLALVEIWENTDSNKYFALVPSEEDSSTGALHELGGRDFEEAAEDFEEAIMLREVFALLPLARRTRFQPLIRKHFRRHLRRKGVTFTQADSNNQQGGGK